MKQKNRFLKLPVQVLGELQTEELGFVVAGGSNDFIPIANNKDAICAGTNNYSGSCSGTNNGSGSCKGTNNSSGTCNEVNNGSGRCNVGTEPTPDKPTL